MGVGGVRGSLRYAFKESDSILLKLYAVVFLAVTLFLTVLWILAIITWMGRLQNAAPTGRVWGFIPFLVVIYLALEAFLFLPLYLPARYWGSG